MMAFGAKPALPCTVMSVVAMINQTKKWKHLFGRIHFLTGCYLTLLMYYRLRTRKRHYLRVLA